MSRAASSIPGQIHYVGSGPGDPGLLTVHAQEIITQANLVYVDPDIPQTILALIGSALDRGINGKRPRLHTGSGALNHSAIELDGNTSESQSLEGPAIGGEPTLKVVSSCAEGASEESVSVVRTTLGSPEEVAKIVAEISLTGVNVVRLVSGDPLTSDVILKEIEHLSEYSLAYEIVPGIPPAVVIPGYAGMALGSSHAEADIRGGYVNWDKIAAMSFPIVLTATATHLFDAAKALIERGIDAHTQVAVTAYGTTCQQKTIDVTLDTMANASAVLAGTLIVTIGDRASVRGQLNWWESRALFGWNVLVPRTKEQAGDMSERLITHGAIPMEVPTISVEPPRSPARMERAVKGLIDGRYQWVVFTSTNAARAIWEKFEEFGLDARAFSGVKIACIGHATAARVRAMGIEPELIPEKDHSSQGLLDVFPPFDDIFDPVNRVLLPRADIATETLAEGLRERGWEIDDVTAYRTVRAAPPPASTREMIKTGGFDAVCFTSSSTVRNLVGIAGKPHARTLVACIGPKTAETAMEFGLRVDVQPERACVIELVDALAAHASRLRAEGTLPPPRKKARRSRSS